MHAGGKLLTGLLAAAAVVAYALLFHWLVGRAGPWLGWLNLAQHLGVNVGLGILFGRSLRAGREPLVTRLARHVHETMTPELLRYTRQVTWAWTLFFALSALASLLLYGFAAIETWSLFANVLSLPLVAVMFVAENEVRKRVLPPRDRVGIAAAVRAFRAGMRP